MVVLVPPALYQNPKSFLQIPNHPRKAAVSEIILQAVFLEEHLRSQDCVFRGDEVSQLVHDHLALFARDSQSPEIEESKPKGLSLRRAKLAAKDCGVKQIRPELSSKKWPKVRDVFGTIRSCRRCTEFVGEDLSLSFNAALRQVVIQ